MINLLNLFKKKKIETTIRFGREVVVGDIPKCDCCGKTVTFGDYAYLCRDCRDKLPKDIQEYIYLLIPFKEARKHFLKNIIEIIN